MSEHATISSDILARYAGDAASEVDGVRLPKHKAVRLTDEDGRVTIELHIAVDWGASIPAVGREVQERVAAYLARMADLEPARIDVVVDEVVG